MTVDGGANIPVNLAQFGVTLPTLQLPHGLTATSLTVTESGATVGISGATSPSRCRCASGSA